MKVVTLSLLEENFDEILDDVADNKEHYLIQYDKGNVMLIPIESYEVLKDVYTDWVEEPQNSAPVEGFDPQHLPIIAYATEIESKLD